MGARLLSRSKRAAVPTEAGAEFLARMEPILAALDEAEHSVREGGELRGLLRMSMPTSFGIRDAIPRLSAFAARHPNLHVQFLLEDRRQDPVRDAVDVAIRLGRLVDSTATAKLIATVPRVVVASPNYLARHGIPATPNELVQHRIVGGTAAAVPTAWMFDRKESVIPLEPHFSTNENEGAIGGGGRLRHHLDERLGVPPRVGGWFARPVVPRLENGGHPVHAYFPMGPATRAAGRAALDHLVADFQRDADAISS